MCYIGLVKCKVNNCITFILKSGENKGYTEEPQSQYNGFVTVKYVTHRNNT